MASVARYCCCGGDPCVDCNNALSGVSPNNASVVGSTCTPSFNTADYVFSGSMFQNVNRCSWEFFQASGPFLDKPGVVVGYAKQAHVYVPSAGCSISLLPGEWFVTLGKTGGGAPDRWLEKTTGFVCSGGKISGTHVFTVGLCVSNSCTGGLPTITIPV